MCTTTDFTQHGRRWWIQVKNINSCCQATERPTSIFGRCDRFASLVSATFKGGFFASRALLCKVKGGRLVGLASILVGLASIWWNLVTRYDLLILLQDGNMLVQIRYFLGRVVDRCSNTENMMLFRCNSVSSTYQPDFHLDIGLEVVVEQPVRLLRLLDPLLEAPEHPHNHKYLKMTNLHRS